MRILCVLFVLYAFAITSSGVALTSQEIDDAVDYVGKDSGGYWEVSSQSFVTMEVVEDESAVGGAALRITVAAGRSTVVRRFGVEDPCRVSFRYRVDSGEGPSFFAKTWTAWLEIGSPPLPASDYVEGEWAGAVLDKVYSDVVGWEISAGSEDRVVYLDGMEIEEGFELRTEGWGAEVFVLPERELYLRNEYVTVEAIVEDDSYEFLYWENWFSVEGAKWSGVLYKWGPVPPLEAVAGRKFEVNGLKVLAPLKGVTASEILEEGSLTGIRLAEGDGVAGAFFVDVEGPGLLRFDARTAEGSGSASSSVYGELLGEDYAERSIHFGAGTFRHRISFDGDVEVKGFRFDAGYRLDLDVEGQGAVSNEVGELMDEGEMVSLEATPDEGWVFKHWEGDFESTNPKLVLAAHSDLQLRAVFAREIEHADLVAWEEGSMIWQEALVEGASVLKGQGAELEGKRNALGWQVRGPGRLSFDALATGNWLKVYVDGRAQFEILSGEPLRGYEVEVGAGLHRIEIVRDEDDYEREVDAEIHNLEWNAGWRIEARSSEGGMIEGLPLGVSYADRDDELVARAVPEAGYRFGGWWGDRSGTETELRFVASRSESLLAVFVKDVEDDHLMKAQGGFGEWRREDGRWKSPESLGDGELSVLVGEVTGPARIRVPNSSGGSSLFRFVEGGVGGDRSLPMGQYGYIEVPEGTHAFTIETPYRYDGVYVSTELEFLVEYLVELEGCNSTLVTVPDLEEYRENEGLTSGYLAYPTEVSVETEGVLGSTFVEWSGPLAGLGASGSFVVSSPIKAEAKYSLGALEIGDISWTVEPADGIYVGSRFRDTVGFNGSSEQVTFTTTLEGPGALVMTGSNLLGSQYRIGAEGEFEDWVGLASLPEGTHEVTFVATVSEDARVDKQGWRPPVGLNYHIYRPGFAVYAAGFSSFGGSVKFDPSGGYYAKGDVVTVTAIPDVDSVFKGWMPPHEGKEMSFEHTVDGEEGFEAHFAAGSQQGELSWEFEGVLPVALHWAPPPFETRFRWLPRGEDPQEMSTATTTFMGPGVLWVDLDFANGGYVFPHDVFLDGERLEVTEEVEQFGGHFGMRVVIGEGEHSVVIEARWAEPGEVARLGVNAPVMQTEFTISASADSGGVVSGGNETGVYAFGERVEFEASELDSNEREFAYWRENFGDRDIVSYARTLVVEARLDGGYRAVYGAPMVAEFEIGKLRGVGGSVSESETVLGPEGGKAIQFGDGSRLQMDFVEDGVISFWALFEGGSAGGLGYEIGGDAVERGALAERESGWVYCALYVEGGRSLKLIAEGSTSGGFVADFTVERGWGPSWVIPAGRAVDIEKIDEGSARLSVAESEGDFGQWLNGREAYSSDKDIVATPGERAVFRPTFGLRLDSSLGAIVLNHNRSWSEGSNLGFDEEVPGLGVVAMEFRWSPWNLKSAPARDVMSLELEGPKVVEFDNNSNYLKVYIDGELLEIHEGIVSEHKEGVLVPSGAHTLEFEYDWGESGAYAAIFTLIDITEGVYLLDSTSGEGVAFPQRGIGWYELGEEVEYIAKANSGYAFTGWMEPYDSAGETLSIRAGVDPKPTPVFSAGDLEQYEIGGAQWRGTGLEIEQKLIEEDSRVKSVSSMEYLEDGQEATLESTVVGPVVWMMDAGVKDYVWMLFMDGKRILDYDGLVKRLNGEIVYVGIPDGEHTLEIRFWGFQRFFPLDSLLEMAPGYMLSALGAGCDVSVVPEKNIYSSGDEVEVFAESSGDLEWLGLPLDAAETDRGFKFKVDAHLKVSALRWSERELFGTKVLHAANGEWIDEATYYESPFDGFAESAYLKFEDLPNGLLRMKFNFWRNSYPDSVLVKVWLNGRIVENNWDGWSNGRYLDMTAPISGAEDEVVVEILDNRIYRNFGLQIYVVEMSHEVLEVPDYLADWIGRVGFVPQRYSVFDPARDFDGDRITNYVEFLSGTDPERSDRILEISLGAEGGLWVSNAAMLEGASEQFVLRARYNGTLVAPELVLESSESDPVDGFMIRRVRDAYRDGAPLLLFYEYIGDYPTLDELLEQVEE